MRISDVEKQTGFHLSPGCGIAAHVYNRENGLVPDNAVMLSTVMDCVAAIFSARASACASARIPDSAEPNDKPEQNP